MNLPSPDKCFVRVGNSEQLPKKNENKTGKPALKVEFIRLEKIHAETRR